MGEVISPLGIVKDDFADPRILLVEDFSPMRRALSDAIEAVGISVQTAGANNEALDTLVDWSPNLVLLDLSVEEGAKGLSICRKIRELTTVPVMVMAAPGDEALVIQALEMGAVDYLTRPLDLDVLFSKVRLVLAKSAERAYSQAATIEVGPVIFHSARREVSIRGTLVHFPKLEYDILLALALQSGNIITREELMDRIWGRRLSDTKTLAAHILRIRHKVELDVHKPVHIITVRGIGYYFDPVKDQG